MKITTFKTQFVYGRPFAFEENINFNPEYYELLRERLKIKRVVGENFIRLGKANDGGYIMVDNFNVSGGVFLILSE